jgi:hypothetical protein
LGIKQPTAYHYFVVRSEILNSTQNIHGGLVDWVAEALKAFEAAAVPHEMLDAFRYEIARNA